jgi:hypothetical protein
VAPAILACRDIPGMVRRGLYFDNAPPRECAHLCAMPMYSFNGSEREATDIDLPNDTVARQMALETFGQMIRDLAAPDRSSEECRMDVRDADGGLLFELSFVAKVR